MKTHRLTRLVLIGLEIFLAAGAIGGAIAVVPSFPLEWLVGSPFSDYTIPALALGLVIGGGALLAAALLALRHPWGLLLSAAVGVGMAIFEVVETSVMGLDIWLGLLGLRPGPLPSVSGMDAGGVPALLGVPLPLWLQPFYFLLGLVILALALRLWSRQPRGRLRVDAARA